METPEFVRRDNVMADNQYLEWLQEVKKRYSQHQIKAAIKVNNELLEFYWSLGCDIVNMDIEHVYGKSIMANLSADLMSAFPGQTGFSVDNLYMMKRWYSFYYQHDTIFDQVGQKSQMPLCFHNIPWRHHVEIIKKCKSVDEALFYVAKITEGNWSRRQLEDNIAADLYSSKGTAITNFTNNLPETQGALAQEVLKDPYHFEFLSLERGYEEKDLENALVANITKFLLELGQGFAFVGRQMELRMPDGNSYFPDLVFYHIKLKCYVIVELKAVEYKPEFAGKLNFYVTAADKLLKGEDDNPTIGVIICKSSDKTVVEWSLQDINKPLGVATYQLKEIVDRTINELELKKHQ